MNAKLREARELLHDSEEKYRNLFNYCPTPMWIYDLETLCFLDVNEAAVRGYGYTRDEFLNMTIAEIRPKEDVALVKTAIGRLKQNIQNFNQVFSRHRKKNGELIQVKIESSSISFDGKWAQLVLATDITAEVEANRKLKTAQEIAALGYWNQNLLDGSMHWSDEVYGIFEVDPESFELTFENLVNKFHPDDRHVLFADPDKLLKGNEYYENEHRILSHTGKPKWVYERIRVVRDANGKPVKIEGVTLDIDKRKQAELEIKRKNQLLQATHAFASKLLMHNDWITAIKESFNIIGETVSVEDIYYFENHVHPDTSERLTSQRINWRNDGTVVLDDPAFQNIPFSVFGSFQTLSTGKPFHSIVSQLPEGPLKTTLAAQHIKSLLALPVFVNNVFHGFIGFNDTKSERSWQEDEVSFLDTLAFNLATTIEKRKVENEVRKSREQFQSVINNLPGITYRCLPDKDWTMTFLSDEVERMIGYTAADFIDNKTRSFASIIHPDDLPGTYSILKKIKRKEPFELEYRMVCKNSEVIWVKENGRGIFDDNDKLVYIDGVIIDITTNKQQQEALRDSNERFELVLKATGEAIVDWDIEKDIAIWGDGFRQLFGYNLDVYDNHLWSRNIHPHDKERVMATLQETIQDPAQFFFFAEFRYLKANGDIAHVQHRGIFVRDASGKAIRAIGSMTDITNLVEHTRKVEEQNDVLKEIAWTQSHVVRAPLASLMGLLELMKNRECMNLDEKELLEKLDVAADELDTVIHKIVQTTEHIL